MTRAWDTYYVIFLSGFLALAFPILLGILSWVIRGRKKRTDGVPIEATRVGQTETWKDGRKLNTRYFLAINVAIVLFGLSLVLIPMAASLDGMVQGGKKEEILKGLFGIVTVGGFLGLALFYASRKGDLGWLKSHRPSKKILGDS